jgi:hypothetical protein
MRETLLSGVRLRALEETLLEWKPRLVLLLVALASVALFVSLLHVGSGTSIVQYSW